MEKRESGLMSMRQETVDQEVTFVQGAEVGSDKCDGETE
jgi:hypothetical protein